jgi:hypothetical protein
MLVKAFPFIPTGHFANAAQDALVMLRTAVRTANTNYDTAFNNLRREMRNSLHLSDVSNIDPTEEEPVEDFSRFLDVGYMPENEPHITKKLQFDKGTSAQLSYILLASIILDNLYQQAT